ncbi:MAG: type II toxin-antitoxin system RelE family toxin [Patescibacteria group bacterium]
MRIIISPRAERQLRKLSKVNQIIVAKKIRSLGLGSTKANEKLTGYKSIYRTRVGDIRIVYKRSRGLLYIILIGNRRDIYDRLKKLLG